MPTEPAIINIDGHELRVPVNHPAFRNDPLLSELVSWMYVSYDANDGARDYWPFDDLTKHQRRQCASEAFAHWMLYLITRIDLEEDSIDCFDEYDWAMAWAKFGKLDGGE